jgi:hypothetical protein
MNNEWKAWVQNWKNKNKCLTTLRQKLENQNYCDELINSLLCL